MENLNLRDIRTEDIHAINYLIDKWSLTLFLGDQRRLFIEFHDGEPTVSFEAEGFEYVVNMDDKTIEKENNDANVDSSQGHFQECGTR